MIQITAKKRLPVSRPVEDRKTWLAIKIVALSQSYSLAQMFEFYDWATEQEGDGGKMTFEVPPRWDTGKRLRRFTYRKPSLPDDWDTIAPEFARIYNNKVRFDAAEQATLFDAADQTVTSPTPPQRPAVSPLELSAFHRMISACKQAQRPTQQLAYFDSVRLLRREDSKVTLAVPHKDVSDYIEHHLLGILREPFRTAFGNAQLHWEVLEPADWESLKAQS